MKRNMVTRSIGAMLILRQGKEDPSDAEWDECMRQLTTLLALRSHGRDVKVLVITDGGAPNVSQRERLQKALEKSPIPVAVVSDNVKARITSSAVALLNRHHRSFANADLDQAYAHLGASPEERRKSLDAIKAMDGLID
jgi:hypothetical protein